MSRRDSYLPFLLATATGAVTVAAVIQYQKQKAAALKTLADHSKVIETRLGPVEVGIAGEGDPVVIIHGLLGCFQQGLVVGEPLVDAGYQVIAISRFGYERSPLPADGSPAAQADVIAALLDALNIPQAVVIGVSAGGPSAAEFAIRHPARTRALIMVAAVSQLRDIDLETTRTTQLNLLLIGYTSDVALWLMVNYALKVIPFSLIERPTLRSLMDRPALMSMYRRLTWGLWPAAHRRAGVDNDIAQIKSLKLNLKKITAPTLVLHGTDDELVPYETGLYTASQIPGAKFLGFDRGEHGLFVTQYDEVWPEVFDFVRAAKKPSAKKPAARKPAAKAAPTKAPVEPAARKPAARKPAPKRPAASKPAALKRPAARKPAAPKKPATRRRAPRATP